MCVLCVCVHMCMCVCACICVCVYTCIFYSSNLHVHVCVQVARLLGKSVVSEGEVQDSAPQDTDDDDQPDNMDVSGGDIGERGRGGDQDDKDSQSKKDQLEKNSDSSLFETAPTHQRLYPSLPPMDTQLSFLTPSAQPSAPPLATPPSSGSHSNDKKPSILSKKGVEAVESSNGGYDSPRIVTLLALRSTRSGTKKVTAGSPSTSAAASSSASASSSRTASTILETLQHGKTSGDSPAGTKKQLSSSSLSASQASRLTGSSSKRKPSPRSVRHAVPVIANKPRANGSRNGSKASSPELEFETARERSTREAEEQLTSKGSGGERESGSGGKQSDVIIRTNTYTHLGTKRKSTGAFKGSGTSLSDSTSPSENWQTAQQAGEGGNKKITSPSSSSSSSSSSTSSSVEPSPSKRLRSMDTPSAPSLRRALGGSGGAAKVTARPQNSTTKRVIVKNGGRGTATPPPASGAAAHQGQQGHTRSLSIGSGLAAMLSRPISGKLMKSPVLGGSSRKQGSLVKKEASSHSWISHLFHKS